MPKKLKLNLEDLKVESFITSLDEEGQRAMRGGGGYERGYILITTIPFPVPESLSCFHACMTHEYITCACTRDDCGVGGRELG